MHDFYRLKLLGEPQKSNLKGLIMETLPRQINVLKHSLTLSIANKDKVGKEVDKTKVIQVLSQEMCKSFGGMRRWIEDGIYLNKSGDMIYEENTILKSWITDNQKKKVGTILKQYFNFLSKELDQEAAAYWIDNDLFLIELDDEADKFLNKNPNKSVFGINKVYPVSYSTSKSL